MPDEILTLPVVVQLLKAAEKTVYSIAQKSQLPAFKVGAQWRFQWVDIDRWIEQQKANAEDDGERRDGRSLPRDSFNRLKAGFGLLCVACRISGLAV
jgi:excisionase family DNA binding protein